MEQDKMIYNQEQLIDLHTHTNYSDGDLTPNELLKRAIDNNITTIAITDHDTLLGLKNIMYVKDHKETELIKIIPGIELSAKSDKGRMHILGYGIDINNENLNNKIEILKNNSVYSVLALVNQLKLDYNIIFSTEDIKNLFATTGNIGRVQLAWLCIKYGYATTVYEAFDKYLIDAYRKTKQSNKGIEYEECLNLIKDAKGLSVLAHPKTLRMNYEQLKELLIKMKSYGLDGIEAYHSSHSSEEIKQYLTLANELDLLISGGSDYHGPITKPDIELGTSINNNIKVKKLTILNKLM